MSLVHCSQVLSLCYHFTDFKGGGVCIRGTWAHDPSPPKIVAAALDYNTEHENTVPSPPTARHKHTQTPRQVTTAEWIQYRAKLHVQITQLLCNTPPAPTTRLFFPPVLKPRLPTKPPHPVSPLPLPAASSLHPTVKCINCS